jgi:chlorophyllide a reductase subunit Y
MGPAGAGSLGDVVNAAMNGKARFDEMRDFFEGVGQGHAAGVWEDVPKDERTFRMKEKRKRITAEQAREKAIEAPTGC